MSRGVNKVILLGRVGRVENIATNSGQAMCKFSIATPDNYKNKTTGEIVKNTEWHNCVAFGRLAEIANQFVKKGYQVYVEGKIKTNKYKGDDGSDKYAINIMVSNLEICESKKDGIESNGNVRDDDPDNPPYGRAGKFVDDGFDDDIPF